MVKDPYTTLGVAKSASADEIKTAFRNLAKKYHPDKTKGDKAAEVKFKEINTANDILSDPAKRKKFDRGEIDAEGNERGGNADRVVAQLAVAHAQGFVGAIALLDDGNRSGLARRSLIEKIANKAVNPQTAVDQVGATGVA
jgi:DnaJ-class molecular chaperone